MAALATLFCGLSLEHIEHVTCDCIVQTTGPYSLMHGLSSEQAERKTSELNSPRLPLAR